MEMDVSFHPMDIHLLGTQTVMFQAQPITHLTSNFGARDRESEKIPYVVTESSNDQVGISGGQHGTEEKHVSNNLGRATVVG